MCDYSLHSVRTRPANVGEKLVTHNFGTGTRGFAAPEDCSVAVCVSGYICDQCVTNCVAVLEQQADSRRRSQAAGLRQNDPCATPLIST